MHGVSPRATTFSVGLAQPRHCLRFSMSFSAPNWSRKLKPGTAGSAFRYTSLPTCRSLPGTSRIVRPASERLIPEIEARGHQTTVMDLPSDDPSASLESYADVVAEAMSPDPEEAVCSRWPLPTCRIARHSVDTTGLERS
jgi:hypothetical protein